MSLKIYNTLTRKKEIFKPIENKRVGFYHCGPTVYWIQSIGNLRGMFCGDTIRRTLEYLGYKVIHIRNYTDVGHLTGDNLGDADLGEDRMEKAARLEKISPRKIANKYIAVFEKDTQNLNFLEPTYKPRATEFVPEIINAIQMLLGKKIAYATDLAVYFDVSRAKNYDRLTRQKIEEKLGHAGKGEIADPQKKHPVDFALWFFKAGKHKNALQTWPAPFGQGFPGWHIECSVMAKKYLGDTIDIHMGGVEHIPIHHTNEIAQSEALNKRPFVNYWVHNNHLLLNNKKISKSKGNVIFLEEIIKKKIDPLALRYLFAQAHYRAKQNFTWSALKAAQSGLDNLYRQTKDLGHDLGQINKEFKNKFIAELTDDFNLPQALATAQEILKSGIKDKDKLATLLDFDQVLGFNLDKIKKKKLIIPDTIKKLVQKREQVRKRYDWPKADLLRKEIENKGYQIEDTNNGPKIGKK